MQNVHLTPSTIAELFGVNVSTVKRWVDKGFIKATVTPGGHRRIHKKDLATFIASRPKYAQKSYVLGRIDQQDPSSYEWQKYYLLLHMNKPREARSFIEQLFLKGSPLLDICTKIIVPTLHHIGSEWLKGKIEIHEEHRMSFLIRTHLMYLDGVIPDVESEQQTAILACTRHENHEIPLQIAALLLKNIGWKSIILGINTPIAETIKAAKIYSPQAICITKVLKNKNTEKDLDELVDYALSQNMHIVYAGSGWTNATHKKYANESNVSHSKSFEELLQIMESL